MPCAQWIRDLFIHLQNRIFCIEHAIDASTLEVVLHTLSLRLVSLGGNKRITSMRRRNVEQSARCDAIAKETVPFLVKISTCFRQTDDVIREQPLLKEAIFFIDREVFLETCKSPDGKILKGLLCKIGFVLGKFRNGQGSPGMHFAFLSHACLILVLGVCEGKDVFFSR